MADAPNLRDTFEKHTQVWNNDRHRKMAASILIRMSTNLLLSNDVDTWLPNAFTILVIEYYDPTREINATIPQSTEIFPRVASQVSGEIC